ncbi:hypothetical protein CCHR01_17880 [Colletotrichum chrysophilum]|uniref:Uncharacterized protein n=1 Tax=Colletotrichum chrysophilum TaxID=1836956 RepID=A0AAD9A1C1_9PEZI|nr:hypothetical protein CCHR01_17880 [Colletotrichum chrysophilum]
MICHCPSAMALLRLAKTIPCSVQALPLKMHGPHTEYSPQNAYI